MGGIVEGLIALGFLIFDKISISRGLLIYFPFFFFLFGPDLAKKQETTLK